MEGLAANGVVGVLAQADAVQKFVALLLLVMSVATWYLILAKAWQVWRVHRRGMRAAARAWEVPSMGVAVEAMRGAHSGDPFYDAAATASALSKQRHHSGDADSDGAAVSEHALRVLRRSLRQSKVRLDSGLGVLASIGATAPFVGLFGTVWGIYHALIGIGFTGQATIDKVAGPVGEALIMTAFGLAVAIPAVLAYNFAARANRHIAAELEAFAHDLHAWATAGTHRPVVPANRGR